LVGGVEYAAVVLNVFDKKEGPAKSSNNEAATPSATMTTQCFQALSKNTETSSWKSTETKKFVIKYPEGWEIKENQLDSTLTKDNIKIVFYNFAGDHLPSVVAKEIPINFAGQEVIAKQRLPGMFDPRLGTSPNWTILAKIGSNSNCSATVSVVSSPSAPDSQLNKTILLILSDVRIKDLEEPEPKTYQNEVLGVSFRYPGSWYGIVTEDLYDSSSSYVQLVLQETQYRDQQALELILTKSSQDSSYQSVVRENGKIPIKIGGYNALKVTKNQEITAVLKKDDDYYTLHIRKNEQNLLPIRSQEISKIFDQILSTFKFL